MQLFYDQERWSCQYGMRSTATQPCIECAPMLVPYSFQNCNGKKDMMPEYIRTADIWRGRRRVTHCFFVCNGVLDECKRGGQRRCSQRSVSRWRALTQGIFACKGLSSPACSCSARLGGSGPFSTRLKYLLQRRRTKRAERIEKPG